jgi:hypothetical protein
MRANEILTELVVATGITDILKQKGYKRLGAGQDQLVFLEPGSKMVLKIFGTNESSSAGSDNLSFPQQTFVAFAKYCAANPNNEFLPYFSGWETFDFNGKRYLQIRCERMFAGSKYHVFGVLEDIADSMDDGGDPEEYLANLIDDGNWWGETVGSVITMLGSDGHIVISDPFFSGWAKREI